MNEIRTIRNVSALTVRGVQGREHCREDDGDRTTAAGMKPKTNILGDEQISKVLIIRSASQNRLTWASHVLFTRRLSPSVEK